MILKNKKIIKAVALSLVLALTVGSFIILKTDSKADSVNENEVVANNDYKEFINGFRKDGIDITITTLNDLYDEFDNYENIDESIRENILAKTSDEVIIQFLLEEQKEFYKINQEVEDISIFSEELEDNAKKSHGDFIKDIESEYYKKGKDTYKKVTTFTNKYCGDFKITSIDEPENNNTRGVGKYTKLGEPKNEIIFKEYGNRKFSYGATCIFSDISVSFGYTLEYGRVEARYIKGELTNRISPVVKFTTLNEVITDSVAENLNEKITAEAEYQGTHGAAFWGGYDTAKWKVKMSVEKLADSNHSTKCGMNVRQYAQWYEQWF